MRYGIVGSRKRIDKKSVEDFIKTLNTEDIVVSGGCAGVDLWAEEAARRLRIKVLIFLPDLPPNGSPRYEFTKAFYARNLLIAENSDILHAFVTSDRKGGTENTIKYAKQLGKKIVIHEP